MANNADTVVGWLGLSFALVLGYGAYKNKTVLGPNGIISTTIRTGKLPSETGPTSGPVSTGPAPTRPAGIPGASVINPSGGIPQMFKSIFGGSPQLTSTGSVAYV